MRYLVLLVLTVIMSSCNFSEEITFNKDGTGTFSVSYDMGVVMKEIKKMGGDTAEKKQGEKQDTIFYFKDFIEEKADSIATLSKKEQQQLKAMEKMSMQLRMDESEEIFEMVMGIDFSSVNELKGAIETLDEAQKMNNKGYPEMGRLQDNSIAKGANNALENVEFTFDGKNFSRTFIQKQKETVSIEEIDKEMSQLKDMKGLFEAMTYTVTYNFPSKIKKVSHKKAKLSKDKKSVTLTVNFLDLMKEPTLLNLDVVLK